MTKYIYYVTYEDAGRLSGPCVGAYLNKENAKSFIASRPIDKQSNYTIHSTSLSDFSTEVESNVVNLLEVADQFSGAILFDGEQGVQICKADGFFYFDRAFTPFNEGQRVAVTETDLLTPEELKNFKLTAENLTRQTNKDKATKLLENMTKEERDQVVTRFGYLLP